MPDAAAAKPAAVSAGATSSRLSKDKPPAVQAAALPIAGKGMWIYEFDRIARGRPKRIVDAAKGIGLTHIYVRAGSSRAPMSGWSDIVSILPIAHEAGLKVIAWDFPYLHSPAGDARRARRIMTTNVNGHRVDGFAADIETRAEGTNLTKTNARKYASWIRDVARATRTYLVLVPPRPNPFTVKFYPYEVLVPRFDAVAPMVYWGRQAPDQATRWALGYLKRFGKPVAPVGQAYDMGPEGGPKGRPKARALYRFMHQAATDGAVGVSFWSWQHAHREQWESIQGFPWPPGKHA